jgi:uncharacterized membrane protein YraQ (UPF0718 family)/copper chaperone CopZ
MPLATEILRSTVGVFVAMAPYLLLGFALAGLLHVLVPRTWVVRHLGGRGWFQVVKAALVGIPLPLCSCGVIPFASSLRKQGAGRGPTTAFLIATPQTGVDSLVVTYSFLGLPFALFRIVAALVTGTVGGWLAAALDRSPAAEQEAPQEETTAALGVVDRIRLAARFGLVELVRDVAGWLVVGVFLAGLIETLLPPESLSPEKLGGQFASMVAVVIVAVPMYVCATASVPIAAALVAKGMPLGAALVFLVAGPATNAATISVFAKALGKRTVAVYVGTIVALSIALGWLFETVFGGLDLPAHSAHHHHEGTTWWSAAAAAILAVLVARALYQEVRERLARPAEAPAAVDGPQTELLVTGMTCNNCRSHVEEALRAAAPGTAVQVDLESGRACILGAAPNVDDLVQAVVKAGYRAQLVPAAGKP